MNCPHTRARGKEIACKPCIDLAAAKVPRTITALRAVLAKHPESQREIWELVVAAVEESTSIANVESAERIQRVCSAFGFDPIERYLGWKK